MANALETMANMLVGELKRLASLEADDPGKVAAECMRAKAMNETVKTACVLVEFHMRSEMLRIGKGPMLSKPGAHGMRKTRKLEPGSAVSDGGRTSINDHGEFETDDGLDDFTAKVPNHFDKTEG